MSNRTLLELNHDYCPTDHKLMAWAEALRAYIRGGNVRDLPEGVTFKHMRHHSEPCPLAKRKQTVGRDPLKSISGDKL